MARHKARKRFGQHFLQDQDIIQRIITVFNPQKGQTIIEIGPGKGALTAPLLAHINKLHVLEIDRDFSRELTNRHDFEGKIVMHCLDALTYDFGELDSQHLRILGNLPYNISTPLVFHLLSHSRLIDDMVFMLQEEVVDRLCASPGKKDFGYLSVVVQANCSTEKFFTVESDAFSPPPKVRSAVIRLQPYTKYLNRIYDYPNFIRILRQAFSQRRKMLRNNLKGLLDEQKIISLGIAPEVRAETLSIDDFIRLANAY